MLVYFINLYNRMKIYKSIRFKNKWNIYMHINAHAILTIYIEINCMRWKIQSFFLFEYSFSLLTRRVIMYGIFQKTNHAMQNASWGDLFKQTYEYDLFLKRSAFNHFIWSLIFFKVNYQSFVLGRISLKVTVEF